MPIPYTFNDEDNRPDFVEPGVYPAFIQSAQEKVSKSSGNDMIEVCWELENGLRVWDYLTFTEKTQWRVDTFLKACRQAPKKGEEVTLDAEAMRGWTANLELIVEDDGGGRKRNRVKAYLVPEVNCPPAQAASNAEKQPAAKPPKDERPLPF